MNQTCQLRSLAPLSISSSNTNNTRDARNNTSLVLTSTKPHHSKDNPVITSLPMFLVWTLLVSMAISPKHSMPPLVWRCGCGQVEISMASLPYFNLDCHCSACTPVAKYLDEKSDAKGISPIVHETGVAKAFFMLDKVKFVKGKDKLAGVKLGEDGKNVRAYTTCCNTLVIGDSPVPFPFRPFNRAALKNSDGSAYTGDTDGPVWGCKGGDNPWYDKIPEPKHPGDPEWLIEKIKALEVEGHDLGSIGDFEGDKTPGFFPDPDEITEFVPKP